MITYQHRGKCTFYVKLIFLLASTTWPLFTIHHSGHYKK